ncbi:MAG: ATP-binding cassette domain-containing protein [Planctomycetota bacterium]|jgi:ABC-2 type transport system ATP-binding protein
MSLRLENVTRTFGKQIALSDVSIHVEKGECYGFIGHNGAGKTTAMRLMLGLLPLQAGRVVIDGFDASRYPREARARMGALIERPGFHGHWSGRANLLLLDKLAGTRTDVDRLLEMVGLGDTGTKPVRAYSQGMRQRLGVAQALLGDPAYILLDEPTNGLDPDGIAEMRTLLQHLTHDENRTVLLSSHQLHELEGVADRVGVLRQGKLITEERLETLLRDGRYCLRTPDAERARELLAGSGLSVEPADGAVLVDLEDGKSGAVLKSLVEADVNIESFAPHRISLEEVYHSQSGHVDTPRVVEVAPPAERLAKRGAVRRLQRHEAARWIGQWGVPVMLALPVLAGLLHMVLRSSGAAADTAQIESGELASATAVNAFEGVAWSLHTGLRILVYVVLGLASQSIAGEFAGGTLRNVLLRPATRLQVAWGKGLALVGMAVTAYLILAGLSVGLASLLFEWTGVVEVLPNGKTFPLVPVEELWPEFRHALLSPVLPLAAYAGIGFLAGAIVRRSAAALSLALVVGFLLDSSRAYVGESAFLPPTYVPSLGRSSYIDYFLDFSTGASNAIFEFSATEVWVPAIWALATFAVAGLVFRKRYVP